MEFSSYGGDFCLKSAYEVGGGRMLNESKVVLDLEK